jgi:hypothetical protein
VTTTRLKGTEISVRRKRRTVDQSGLSFDSSLEQEGIREEVEAGAIRRVLTWQLAQAIRNPQKTKQTMAKQLPVTTGSPAGSRKLLNNF